jgi:hypothetical protein
MLALVLLLQRILVLQCNPYYYHAYGDGPYWGMQQGGGMPPPHMMGGPGGAISHIHYLCISFAVSNHYHCHLHSKFTVCNTTATAAAAAATVTKLLLTLLCQTWLLCTVLYCTCRHGEGST